MKISSTNLRVPTLILSTLLGVLSISITATAADLTTPSPQSQNPKLAQCVGSCRTDNDTKVGLCAIEAEGKTKALTQERTTAIGGCFNLGEIRLNTCQGACAGK